MNRSTSPTNPYTAHLLSLLPSNRADLAVVAAFVADWDRLETLVIHVFRTADAGAEDAAEWTALRTSLTPRHAAVASDLDAHWSFTRVAGQPCAQDPFRALLDVPTASALVGNWSAMQTLPAAREALNRWLVALADASTPTATPPAPDRRAARGTASGPWR